MGFLAVLIAKFADPVAIVFALIALA